MITVSVIELVVFVAAHLHVLGAAAVMPRFVAESQADQVVWLLGRDLFKIIKRFYSGILLFKFLIHGIHNLFHIHQFSVYLQS